MNKSRNIAPRNARADEVSSINAVSADDRANVLATAATSTSPATKVRAVDKGALHIDLEPGEDQDAAEVKARVHPVVSATATMRAFDSALANTSLTAMVGELSRHVNDVKAGTLNRPEAMLLSQAHALDVIFNSLAQRAGANIGKQAELSERYLRMALKAQSQCRTTLEALAEIKAPKSATFIKQANIAEQQQVNNGNVVNGGANSAHEKTSDRPNELLTESPYATLDTGREGTTGGENSSMDAMVKIDRAEDEGRKNTQQPERPAARRVRTGGKGGREADQRAAS